MESSESRRPSLRAKCADAGSMRPKLFCKLCGAKEDDPDDINKEEQMAWARHKEQSAGGRTRAGYECVYCLNVRRAEYADMGLPAMSNQMQLNDRAADKFFQLRVKHVAILRSGRIGHHGVGAAVGSPDPVQSKV